MTYQPNVPNGSVNLNLDWRNLQINFQQLNTQFSVDHVPLNATMRNGYHQDIHFNPFSTTTTNPPNNYVSATAGTSTQYPDDTLLAPRAVPPVVAGIGQLWSAQVNDAIGSVDTGLYWLSGAGKKVAFTRNFTPSAILTEGSTFLPGGFILQWGTVTMGAVSTVTITFPKVFPNAFLNLQTTPISTLLPPAGSNATIFGRSNPVLASTANVQVSNTQNAILNVFWLAIGY